MQIAILFILNFKLNIFHQQKMHIADLHFLHLFTNQNPLCNFAFFTYVVHHTKLKNTNCIFAFFVDGFYNIKNHITFLQIYPSLFTKQQLTVT